MGWLSDVWSGVSSWLDDNIFNPLVNGVSDFFGGVYNNNSSFKEAVDEKYNIPSGTTYTPNNSLGVGSFVGNTAGNLATGIENAWYSLTGQTEKTSASLHKEEREDNGVQRLISDMKASGLSPYFYNGGASPSSSSTGMGKPALLDQIAALQTLKSNDLAIKEREHNLSLSELLGIRTGDKNYAAKWAELGNVLFGFDPTKVEGGVIPYVIKMLRGDSSPELPPFETDSSVSPKSSSDYKTEAKQHWFEFKYNLNPSKAISGLPFGEALQGATLDQAKKVISDLSKLQSLDDKEKSKMMSDIIESVSPTVGQDHFRTNQLNDTLDSAVAYAVHQMKMKGDSDSYSVGRLAEFLSRKYDVSEDMVKKKIYDLL